MNKLRKFYRLQNILSIDVAVGAACCGAWFADYFEVQLRAYALICLGLTVWIIYTADHLLDAFKIKGEASTLRHKFHQKHFKMLMVFMVFACSTDFVLLFFLRTQVLHAGIFLITIVAVYLLLNRWLSYAKEIAVAVLYCGGVMLPALSLKEERLITADIFVMLCFFFTALINIMIFSWFDHDSDILDGYNSFSIKFGKIFTKKLLIGLFILQMILLIILLIDERFKPLFPFILMNGILYLVFVRPAGFNKAEYYRLAGDVVFLIPALFLMF